MLGTFATATRDDSKTLCAGTTEYDLWNQNNIFGKYLARIGILLSLVFGRARVEIPQG